MVDVSACSYSGYSQDEGLPWMVVQEDLLSPVRKVSSIPILIGCAATYSERDSRDKRAEEHDCDFY